MAASDDKRTGASKTVSNRVSKFRLPERTSRPSDDAYFDRVLSAVERKDVPPAEAEPDVNSALESTSSPAAVVVDDPAAVIGAKSSSSSGGGSSNPVPLRQAEARNSIISSVEARQDAAIPAAPDTTATPTTTTASSRQITALHDDATRRTSPRPAAVSAASLPHDELPSFAEFRRRWSLFLTETHMNLCAEMFRNTAAMGRDHYDTTASILCQAVSKSRRHTFLLLQQLEKMGFVTRKEIRDDNRLLGIRIWFHLIPLQK